MPIEEKPAQVDNSKSPQEFSLQLVLSDSDKKALSAWLTDAIQEAAKPKLSAAKEDSKVFRFLVAAGAIAVAVAAAFVLNEFRFRNTQGILGLVIATLSFVSLCALLLSEAFHIWPKTLKVARALISFSIVLIGLYVALRLSQLDYGQDTKEISQEEKRPKK